MAGDETLSLKCPCGYVKHDVLHLGVWQDRKNSLLIYCGGLFLMKGNYGAACRKCKILTEIVEFNCAFCNRITTISIKDRASAAAEGRAFTIQMNIHRTVVFSGE